MQVNPKTGTFVLDSGSVLSPQLTRSAFLLLPEGRAADVLIRNEPWCSFRLQEGDGLGLAVYFKDETLEALHIAVLDARFGLSWDDWSEEKEMERKRANDQWLLDHGLRAGKKYRWGSVWSDYDPKGGSSSAVIKYSR